MSFVSSDDDPVLVPAAIAVLMTGAHPARAAMLLYLVDWKAAIEGGTQATSIVWTVGADGHLHLDRIADEMRRISTAMRYVDQVRAMFSMAGGPRKDGLEGVAALAVDHVVRTCCAMSDTEVDVLVRSTHPIFRGGDGVRILHLAALADEYAAMRDPA